MNVAAFLFIMAMILGVGVLIGIFIGNWIEKED